MFRQRIAIGLAALSLAAAVAGVWYLVRMPRDSIALPDRAAPLATAGGALPATLPITPGNAAGVAQLARLGDGGGVAMRASADQRLLAVGMDHVGVAIYDAQTLERRELVEMPYQTDWLRAQDQRVAVSSDGRTLAAGLGQVAVIRTADGRQIRFNPIDVSALALSPDGATLATVGQQIRVWRTSDGSLQRSFDNPVFSSGFLDSTTASFSPDGQLLLVADEDLATIVRVADGQQVRSLDGAAGSFFPDSDLVATTYGTGAVEIWSLGDGERRMLLGGAVEAVGDVRPARFALLAISADGGLVAATAWDGVLRVWRVSDGALLATQELGRSQEGAPEAPLGLAFTPDGAALTLLTRSGALRQSQIADGALRREVALASDSAWHLRFSDDGAQLLATGQAADSIGIVPWALGDLTRAPTLPIAGSVAFQDLYSAEALVLTGGGAAPIIWRPGEGTPPPQAAEGQQWYTGALTPDGAQIASADLRPGSITVVRLADQGVVRTIPLPPIEERDRVNRITAVYSADGALLVAANGRTAWVWRASDGALLRSFPIVDREQSSRLLTALALSPDARLLAATTYEGVAIWDVERGARLTTLATASDALPTALRFSPDGRLLAVADLGALRLWGVPAPR